MQIALQLKRNLANLLRFFSYVATLLVGDSRSVRSSAAKDFVRVLDPIDPWLDPSRQHDRVTQFIGSYENISVAMRSRCPDELILASFHGPKRATGPINPLRPSLFAFASLEVKEAGGKIEDTDAKPPWPPEYNYAHHDIICNQQSVSAAMSKLSQSEPARVLKVDETTVLVEIARLMQRPDAQKRFRSNATNRFKRLFEDGGSWRDSWIEVAKIVPEIIYDPNVMRGLRSLWSHDRVEWQRIASHLPQLAEDTSFSSGK